MRLRKLVSLCLGILAMLAAPFALADASLSASFGLGDTAFGGSAAFKGHAQEMTASCVLRDADNQIIHCLNDEDYKTRWSASGREARLTVEAPEGRAIGGIYLKFYNETCPYDVEVRGEEGTWETVFSCEEPYLASFAQLPSGAQAVRIRPKNNTMRLALAEMSVFTEGRVPDWVQRWNPPHEKADLLLVSAHPDDEILFMGGTIPYYAGELQKAVQVAYLVPATPYRKLELLDGLWLCGNTHYPDIGGFPDRFSTSLEGMYRQKGWSEDLLLRHMVGLYRRYQPDVVVTHDVNGEYGHGAHRAAADTAQKAALLAADSEYQHKKLVQTEPWQIQKLYLHLYEAGALRMDWRVPLERFGGKTAFDMAEAAFQCHVSQLHTEYQVEDSGPYDNALFGLAFSTVGEDEKKNDFFEHIAPPWKLYIGY